MLDVRAAEQAQEQHLASPIIPLAAWQQTIQEERPLTSSSGGQPGSVQRTPSDLPWQIWKRPLRKAAPIPTATSNIAATACAARIDAAQAQGMRHAAGSTDSGMSNASPPEFSRTPMENATKSGGFLKLFGGRSTIAARLPHLIPPALLVSGGACRLGDTLYSFAFPYG